MYCSVGQCITDHVAKYHFQKAATSSKTIECFCGKMQRMRHNTLCVPFVQEQSMRPGGPATRSCALAPIAAHKMANKQVCKVQEHNDLSISAIAPAERSDRRLYELRLCTAAAMWFLSRPARYTLPRALAVGRPGDASSPPHTFRLNKPTFPACIEG